MIKKWEIRNLQKEMKYKIRLTEKRASVKRKGGSKYAGLKVLERVLSKAITEELFRNLDKAKEQFNRGGFSNPAFISFDKKNKISNFSDNSGNMNFEKSDFLDSITKSDVVNLRKLSFFYYFMDSNNRFPVGHHRRYTIEGRAFAQDDWNQMEFRCFLPSDFSEQDFSHFRKYINEVLIHELTHMQTSSEFQHTEDYPEVNQSSPRFDSAKEAILYTKKILNNGYKYLTHPSELEAFANEIRRKNNNFSEGLDEWLMTYVYKSIVSNLSSIRKYIMDNLPEEYPAAKEKINNGVKQLLLKLKNKYLEFAQMRYPEYMKNQEQLK